MRRQLLTFVIVDNGSKTERQRTVDHPSFDRQALQAYWPGLAGPARACLPRLHHVITQRQCRAAQMTVTVSNKAVTGAA